MSQRNSQHGHCLAGDLRGTSDKLNLAAKSSIGPPARDACNIHYSSDASNGLKTVPHYPRRRCLVQPSRPGIAVQCSTVRTAMRTGIYPGTSNVMAAHMISIARREYAADWSYASSSGASRGTNGQVASSSSSYSTSSSSGESEAAQPEPLRSGIATMEPDEGDPPKFFEAILS